VDHVEARARCCDIPQICGVYIFHGQPGSVLYVGKAVNLRRRVRQHFGPPSSAPAGRKEMTRRVREIEWIACRTELHALLLEDELIKRLLPPYNRRQKRFQRNTFLAFSGQPFPALQILHRDQLAGRPELFGPYPSEHFARTLLDLLHDYLPLRRCPGPTPAYGCLRRFLGQCAAPCASTVPPGRYAEVVRQARAFLLGDGGSLLAQMAARMDRLSGSREYERAARARDQLELARRLISRQQFYQAFRNRSLVLHSRGRWPGTYLFRRGGLAHYSPDLLGSREVLACLQAGSRLAEFPGPADGRLDALPAFPPGGPSPSRDELLLDRAAIVSGWRRLDPERRTIRLLR
jgi:excinuclease UvrABC nuclease subunit